MRAVKIVNSKARAKVARRCIEQLNLIGRGEMRKDDNIQEIRSVVPNVCPAVPLRRSKNLGFDTRASVHNLRSELIKNDPCRHAFRTNRLTAFGVAFMSASLKREGGRGK